MSRRRLPSSSSRGMPIQVRKGQVGLDDTTIRAERQVAAGRILVEVLEIFAPQSHAHLQTNARIAAMTSCGALRLGQWPVAFRIDQFAARQVAVDILADLLSGDDVFPALEDENAGAALWRDRRGCRT